MLLTCCGTGSSQTGESSTLQFNYNEVPVPMNSTTTIQATYSTDKDTTVTFTISDPSIASVVPQHCLFNIESHQCDITLQAFDKLESTYLIESGAPTNTPKLLVSVFRWVSPGIPQFSESNITMTIGSSKTISASIVKNYPNDFLPDNFQFALSNEGKITMAPMSCNFKATDNLCYFTFHALESGVTSIFESNIENPVAFVTIQVLESQDN